MPKICTEKMFQEMPSYRAEIEGVQNVYSCSFLAAHLTLYKTCPKLLLCYRSQYKAWQRLLTNTTFPIVGTKAFFTASSYLKLKPARPYIYFQKLSTMTPVLVRTFIAMIKNHNHKQLGEERAGTQTGKELRQGPCKEECCMHMGFFLLTCSACFLKTPENHLCRSSTTHHEHGSSTSMTN